MNTPFHSSPLEYLSVVFTNLILMLCLFWSVGGGIEIRTARSKFPVVEETGKMLLSCHLVTKGCCHHYQYFLIVCSK